jgi:hypothetical protein
MSLKGCTRLVDLQTGEFNGLYDLDLGQQDLSSASLLRKVSLENTSSFRIAYRIKILNECGKAWMICNRYLYLTIGQTAFLSLIGQMA